MKKGLLLSLLLYANIIVLHFHYLLNCGVTRVYGYHVLEISLTLSESELKATYYSLLSAVEVRIAM